MVCFHHTNRVYKFCLTSEFHPSSPPPWPSIAIVIDGCPGNWCTRCITTKGEVRTHHDHDELNTELSQGDPTVSVQFQKWCCISLDFPHLISTFCHSVPLGEGSEEGAKGGRNDRRLRQTVKVYLPSPLSHVQILIMFS